MSPGVMSIFSSISSRPSTSTRVGWSSSRRPVRVDATTMTSSSTLGRSSSVTVTAASSPATSVSSVVTSTKPSFETITRSRPGGTATCARPVASVVDGDGAGNDRGALDRTVVAHHLDAHGDRALLRGVLVDTRTGPRRRRTRIERQSALLSPHPSRASASRHKGMRVTTRAAARGRCAPTASARRRPWAASAVPSHFRVHTTPTQMRRELATELGSGAAVRVRPLTVRRRSAGHDRHGRRLRTRPAVGGRDGS